MVWTELIKSARLTAADMTAINSNFNYIRHILIQKGYVVPKNLDCSCDAGIHPAEIQEKFQAVETNIQAIHTAENLSQENDPYYKVFIWPVEGFNLQSEVWRWIDWLQYQVDEILMDLPLAVPQALYDVNDDQIADKNNEWIYVED